MLRHCPIPRFSSSGARRKMPTAVSGKETLHVPPGDQPLDLPDPKDVAREQLPPQKVLKIFSINIIAQGLPFCRRRVSTIRSQTVACFASTEPQQWQNVKGHPVLLECDPDPHFSCSFSGFVFEFGLIKAETNPHIDVFEA